MKSFYQQSTNNNNNNTKKGVYMPSEFFNRQHNQEDNNKKKLPSVISIHSQFHQDIYRATHCILSKREHCAPVVKIE